MPKKRSAGILLFRLRNDTPEVLLGHMGGPFWAKKDQGGWSIPKGEYEEGEDPFEVARREFREELGCPVPAERFEALGEFKQPSGKVITLWSAEGDLDASSCVSNTFEMEWPKGSGRVIEVPEIDRAEWFDLATARRKVLKGHVPALDALFSLLSPRHPHLREEGPSSGDREEHTKAPTLF